MEVVTYMCPNEGCWLEKIATPQEKDTPPQKRIPYREYVPDVGAEVGLDVRSLGPISIQVQVGRLRYWPCSTHSCCSRRVCGCTILATMVFIEMFLFVS